MSGIVFPLPLRRPRHGSKTIPGAATSPLPPTPSLSRARSRRVHFNVGAAEDRPYTCVDEFSQNEHYQRPERGSDTAEESQRQDDGAENVEESKGTRFSGDDFDGPALLQVRVVGCFADLETNGGDLGVL